MVCNQQSKNHPRDQYSKHLDTYLYSEQPLEDESSPASSTNYTPRTPSLELTTSMSSSPPTSEADKVE